MILIRTYKEMTSGEKRSLTLSIKKYADAFAEKHQGDLSGFNNDADVIDTFYAEWLKDSLDSHYAWCSEKNEGAAGYTAKGYHEEADFVVETKAKIRDILAEKIDLASVTEKHDTVEAEQTTNADVAKEDSVQQIEAKKVETQAVQQKPKLKRKNATKLGRNDMCPCGSGKKYKKCCLEDGVEYTYQRGKFVAVS